MILYWGWFPFNAGSTMGLGDGLDMVAGLSATNTAVASGAATMVTIFLCHLSSKGKSIDVFATICGSLSGLIAITGTCDSVHPWEAMVIGSIGGVAAFFSADLPMKYRIDGKCNADVCVRVW